MLDFQHSVDILLLFYGIEILTVTISILKRDPAMSSPLEPILQLEFVTYWKHAVLKAVFLEFLWFFLS